MNSTIAMITLRGMLGRRRALLLFILPALLLILAVVLRAIDYTGLDDVAQVLQSVGVGTILPLTALIAGTGVIGPEIDDGQIMYILTKPIPRHTIILTKLAVAIGLTTLFGAVPMLIAGLILAGTTAQLAVAFFVGTLVGGIAYCAVFTALAVASRFAVVIGLLYALIWESLLGNFAPGAKNLSVQQWSMAVAHSLTSTFSVTSAVGTSTGVIALILTTAVAVVLSVTRLRTLTIASAAD